ncbi:MAG: hypothetical protein WCP29_18730 [Acidobacteriota bacterium]
MPPSKTHVWFLLALLSSILVYLDWITPELIQFPAVFIVPVLLATWYLGVAEGVGFTIVLLGIRWGMVLALGQDPNNTPLIASANFGIRLAVFGLIVYLTEGVKAKEQLAGRVKTLESILPICSFCKRIRNHDGRWEQLESYISAHSEAQFSHGMCEACGREHYPDFVP